MIPQELGLVITPKGIGSVTDALHSLVDTETIPDYKVRCCQLGGASHRQGTILGASHDSVAD